MEKEIIEGHWSKMNIEESFGENVYWLANPIVNNYYQVKATNGSNSPHWVNYVVDKYLKFGNDEKRMLSIGCGDGELERHLASLKAFNKMDAIDISLTRIERAKYLANQQEINDINYLILDVEKHESLPAMYDGIFFNSSLHHIFEVDKLLKKTAAALKPGGYLIINEYVGGNRFDLTTREKEIIHSVFNLIPAKYRSSLSKNSFGELISEVNFFDPAEVERVDPSEAVNSEAIIPSVKKHFDILEYNKIGGTLLHLVLHNIAGHFHENDNYSVQVLNLLFEIEQTLIRIGEISNHFALIVAKNK